ncbi:MAG: Transposase, partial [Olavius algarvensis Gamma 1 endosymbiont]
QAPRFHRLLQRNHGQAFQMDLSSQTFDGL